MVTVTNNMELVLTDHYGPSAKHFWFSVHLLHFGENTSCNELPGIESEGRIKMSSD